MSLSQLFLLGAIAGYTIFLGLPAARIRHVSERWSIGAGAASAGILLFLVVDIMKHMTGPIEEAARNLAQTLIYTGLRSQKTAVFSVGLFVGLVAGIATDLVIAAAGV